MAPTVRAFRSQRQQNQARSAFLFLSPFLILFVLFRLGPVLASFALSFTHFDGLTRMSWAGLANYHSILLGTEAATRLFWQSVGNTLYYTVGELVLEAAIGLGLALLVNAQRLRLKALWRSAYYLPVITSAVAASMIWLWIYNSQAGLLNQLLRALGLPRFAWLGDPKLAMGSIIVMATWGGAGWSMVIYLAGLQGIPASLYEAAKIDGASGWQQLWRITLPLLQPVTLFVVIMGCISNLQMFSQAFVMTGGGPLNATMTVTFQIWNNAFKFMRLGYASAMSFLLFLVIFAASLLNNRLLGGRVEY
ncbi:MAG: carbohydrate ABC transporter permease [Anaerolineae bacterium]